MKRIANGVFILTLVVAMVGLLVFLQKAEARGGGYGGDRGGDVNVDRDQTGSVDTAQGARGGEVAEGPYGGVAAEGPNGGKAAVGPYGAGAAEGPNGGKAVAGPYGGVAAEGPHGNVAVGTRVDTLPVTASEVAVGDQVYYFDSGVYYQACGDGYCVAPAPQNQNNQ